MNTIELNMINSALDDLHAVEMELMRPQEDVVTISACHDVTNVMKKLMAAYLMDHFVPATNEDSLRSLLDKCRNTNNKFNTVDFRHIDCRDIDGVQCKYCMSIENVTYCLHAARQLRDIIVDSKAA